MQFRFSALILVQEAQTSPFIWQWPEKWPVANRDVVESLPNLISLEDGAI